MGKLPKKKDRDETLACKTTEEKERALTQMEHSGNPTLQDILQAITSSSERLEGKIDSLSLDMGLLQDDLKKLADRVKTNEGQLAEALPGIAIMKQ